MRQKKRNKNNTTEKSRGGAPKFPSGYRPRTAFHDGSVIHQRKDLKIGTKADEIEVQNDKIKARWERSLSEKTRTGEMGKNRKNWTGQGNFSVEKNEEKNVMNRLELPESNSHCAAGLMPH